MPTPYDGFHFVSKIFPNEGHYDVALPALKGKYVAIQDIGNGIWKVFYMNVFLGFFDEKHLRNKKNQQG